MIDARTTSISIFMGITVFLVSACGGGGGGATEVPDESLALWLIPQGEVRDGGPGKDGIAALSQPVFAEAATYGAIDPEALVFGVRYNGETRVFPHNIMDWHEIVNDSAGGSPYTVSYCPLTGSAVAWQGNAAHANSTFGVSGLLYNSNLILYDRETDSNWSQMLEQAVNGPRIRERATAIQVIETKWSTWQSMFPNSEVMTLDTGHSINYANYPYGNYLTSTRLLFEPSNLDGRLHPKRRVVGVNVGSASKVYQIDGFGDTTQALNEQVGNTSIVVVGNSRFDFAVLFSRELADGTILTFSPINGELPNVMRDDEGNTWDIFGTAVDGPRTGEQLSRTQSYIAMWFAWAAFFPSAEIHFN